MLVFRIASSQSLLKNTMQAGLVNQNIVLLGRDVKAPLAMVSLLLNGSTAGPLLFDTLAFIHNCISYIFPCLNRLVFQKLLYFIVYR